MSVVKTLMKVGIYLLQENFWQEMIVISLL